MRRRALRPGRGSLGCGAFEKCAAMIAAHVVRVLQHMPGEHGHHGFLAKDVARGHEFTHARHRRGGSGFTTDAVAANHRFRVCDFLFAYGDYLPVRAQDCAQRLSPRDGRANLDRRGESLRALDGFQFVRQMLAVSRRILFETGKQPRQRCRTFRLNDVELGQTPDQAEIEQLLKPLGRAPSCCPCFRPEPPHGPAHASRHCSISSKATVFCPSMRNGLIEFGDVNRRIVAQLLNQAHAIVEIAVDLADYRAVIHALRELRGADLSMRHQNRGLQFRARSISRQARRRVSRAGADGRARAEQTAPA